MRNEEIELTVQQHRKLGIQLFNYVWELMDKPERTGKEDDEMLSAAYASRYHWAASQPPEVNIARAEWLISRICCVLKRAESARYHAEETLRICLENNIEDFDLPFGYEAMARALLLAGDAVYEDYLKQAYQASEHISDPQDKQVLLQDLATLKIP